MSTDKEQEENLYEIPVYKTVETFVHVVASSKEEAIRKVKEMDDNIMVLPTFVNEAREETLN